jgi:hypothetical protein
MIKQLHSQVTTQLFISFPYSTNIHLLIPVSSRPVTSPRYIVLSMSQNTLTCLIFCCMMTCKWADPLVPPKRLNFRSLPPRFTRDILIPLAGPSAAGSALSYLDFREKFALFQSRFTRGGILEHLYILK